MLNPMVLAVDKKYCQNFRELLGDFKIFDKRRKVESIDYDVLLPISKEPCDEQATELRKVCDYKIIHTSPNTKVEKETLNLRDHFVKRILSLCTVNEEQLVKEIPDSWEYYDDLLLLPGSSFQDQSWAEHMPEILDVICQVFKVQRVARKKKVVNDDFRSPKTDMLLGSDPWVGRKENGISYHFDITKSMFSIGNISEKLRVSKFNCKGQVVVDLFAGKDETV